MKRRRQQPAALKRAMYGTGSLPERRLFLALKRAGLPPFVTQLALIKGRRFRYDLTCQEYLVTVEVQGGIWIRGGGAHNRPLGYMRDAEKSRLAQQLGYIVVYVTPGQIGSGAAVRDISAALMAHGWEG